MTRVKIGVAIKMSLMLVALLLGHQMAFAAPQAATDAAAAADGGGSSAAASSAASTGGGGGFFNPLAGGLLNGVQGLVGEALSIPSFTLSTLSNSLGHLGIPRIATEPLSAVSSLIQQG